MSESFAARHCARPGKQYSHGQKTSKNLPFRTLLSPARCYLRCVRTLGFLTEGKHRKPLWDLLCCSLCFVSPLGAPPVTSWSVPDTTVTLPRCGATAYVDVLANGPGASGKIERLQPAACNPTKGNTYFRKKCCRPKYAEVRDPGTPNLN